MELIDSEDITHFVGVTAMYVDMVEHEQFEECDLTSLEMAAEGGAKLPEAVQERFQEGTGVEMDEGYGLTETHGATHTQVNSTYGTKHGSVGQPMRMTDCKIVDENGEEVSPGEEGELLVRGPQVMKGYHGMPEATEAAFTEHGYFRTGDIARRDDVVDRLHESIKLYLTQVSRHILEDADSKRCVDLITFTTNLEHIGDIIEKNLLELAQKKIKNRQQFSSQGWQELTELHARVEQNMQLAMSVFVSRDVETARRLIGEKERLRDMEREASDLHLQRLREGRTDSIETSSLHLDILRDLKRINSHLTAVAYPIVDASGQLRSTRLRKSAKQKTGSETAETGARSAKGKPVTN
jgi:phosphate uptake regulator